MQIVGYYGNLGYQEYDEGDSYYQIRQSCWKRNEMMGRDLRVAYESYKGSRYYGKGAYESQESMKSFLYEEKFADNIANVQTIMSSPLSRKKEARKACAQKKVRFEEQLKEVGVMSNEDIGNKTSIGEPSGPWSIEFSFKELKMSDYYSYVANVDSFVLGVENKEERMLRVFEKTKERA
ncbi:hypothetical protein M9H77_29622 [Catharanthus roseus]|uniref:Uncharacterized protein n=1 Tax=Catharanthus roseus TaxID=4058 RepID=A0ACB9ZUZ1_CATRO|nr:hypothetical protein M9H77_29622 [Catharanthus roseus]